MFSPKVLDRAFVLEFNDVDLDALSGRAPAEDASSTPLALSRMTTGLRLLGKPTDEEWQRFDVVAGGGPRAFIGALHALLAQDNRHFGYRVAREIARFTGLAAEQTAGGDDAIWAAVDVAVLAKVLPRLSGTQAELEPLLAKLFVLAVGVVDDDAGDVSPLERWKISAGILGGPTVLRLPRTALKLWRMRRRLRAQGFVSFIE